MLRISMVLAFLFTAATLLIPAQIMSIYTSDRGVIDKGVIYFLVSSPTYF
jgi:Na+-driven multidrug efflux pump